MDIIRQSIDKIQEELNKIKKICDITQKKELEKNPLFALESQYNGEMRKDSSFQNQISSNLNNNKKQKKIPQINRNLLKKNYEHNEDDEGDDDGDDDDDDDDESTDYNPGNENENENESENMEDDSDSGSKTKKGKKSTTHLKRKNKVNKTKTTKEKKTTLSAKAHRPKYTRDDLINPNEFRQNKNGSLSGWCYLRDENGCRTGKKKFMIISGATSKQQQQQQQQQKNNLNIENQNNLNENINMINKEKEKNFLLQSSSNPNNNKLFSEKIPSPIIHSSDLTSSEIANFKKLYA